MNNKVNFRIVTLASFAIMLVIMLWSSKQYGITGDEYTQNTYGEKVFDYYASFGKNKEALSFKNVYYYGGFYDLLCVTVNKFSPFDPYNTRHFITALFGFMLIVASAMLAKLYKGWEAALITAWFLFLSPRFFGESMNNPKDVPFALGMTLGVYFICRFINAFPKPTMKDSIWLVLSIGFAISVRIGGLMLIPFLAVALGLEWFFNQRKVYGLGSKEVRSLAIRAVVVSIAGYLLGLVFWPYGLEGPFSHPFKALAEMSQFSTGIRMLFEDGSIMSSNIPWYYIPKWISITTPIIVLLAIYASPMLFFTKKYNFSKLAFLFFAALFPLCYVIYKKSPLYDGWRHMFFIFPLFVVLGALTFSTVADMIKSPIGKYAITGLIVLGLLLPAKWSIANHPNEIVYFNELVNGVDGAYGNYETDYYMNSVKQAIYKLADMKDLRNAKDTTLVITNAIEPMWHYIETLHNPVVACDYARYHERYQRKWNYAIFYNRFISKDLLQGGYFPSKDVIAVVKADNTPLCAILKWNDADEAAYQGYKYLQAKDFPNAIANYERAMQLDPRNETLYGNYAIALYSTQTIEGVKKAIGVIDAGLKIDPSNIQWYQIAVALHSAIGDKAGAQQAESIMNELIIKEQGEQQQ